MLPNDADSLAVAEAAAAQARDEGLRVAVIPTRASVQALAALAVHDADRRFEDDVVAHDRGGRPLPPRRGHRRQPATRSPWPASAGSATCSASSTATSRSSAPTSPRSRRTVVDRMLGSRRRAGHRWWSGPTATRRWPTPSSAHLRADPPRGRHRRLRRRPAALPAAHRGGVSSGVTSSTRPRTAPGSSATGPPRPLGCQARPAYRRRPAAALSRAATPSAASSPTSRSLRVGERGHRAGEGGARERSIPMKHRPRLHKLEVTVTDGTGT